ncbi:gliding motility-associated C-terminal domain-containing protein [Mariniflexile litorale]|uniref:Gliding motility-associated C-terminal domain-containing protein n=1 Tax=Mariniflexile litorale TaxID=3045158 RepID=A0AAU7EBL0_9FLAO|nr:gliding motility-associated C-terminal domain-containing protein [Mariniflexile sp. KMM 9835]MDQ8210455.1 gliding motility-associated C-terminal domain-containing protein [Mariniflexile sp. KMM 9835]
MNRILCFVLIIFSLTKVEAQCNVVETITVCDMTVIDGDNDGKLDGIINLYEEYNALPGVTPISTTTGTWFDPNFNFALDESTGDLYLWDLDYASKSLTDYQFQLIDTSSSCPDGILVTVNLILGAFKGYARPVLNIQDVNLEVCDIGSTPKSTCFILPDVDLFQALESVPSPHLNGEWIYEGSSPNFVSLLGSKFTVTIPYSSGPPLVDQETFELTYRISGMSPCDVTLQETTVNISVTRQVFSGYGQATRICELDILNGNYNANINLRDDAFLLQEDTEGVWATDPYGEITSPNDSNININDIYQKIINDNGVRFGCAELEFTYSVKQRSGVCSDAESKVLFKIYEYLRPFEQNDDVLEFCEDDPTGPTSINLYDQLEFTTEAGVLFDYYNNNFTNWSLVSGPSNLGLISSGDLGYSASGTINLQNAPPGNYVFEYEVSPGINCPSDGFLAFTSAPNSCAPVMNNYGFCDSESARVVLTIHPKLYAGEDTADLEFCETAPTIASPLDLFTLLTTNGVDDPIYKGPLGNWVDLATGNSISNPITLPQVNGQQTFNYLYRTITSNDCVDTANLSFTVFEAYQSGISTAVDICSSSSVLNLFGSLGGNPSTTGTWSGPNGYTTTNHNAMFDPASSDAGVYTYTVPNNLNGFGDIMCPGNSSTVTVTLHQSPNAGNGGLYVACRSDQQIDLVDYLDATADSGGTFIDLNSTNALTGSLLDVSQLVSGTYDFRYELQGHSSCSLSTAIISIMVEEVSVPTVTNQTFCASEGATISDLQVSNGIDYNWYETATSTDVLSFGTALINGEDYYVSALDANSCESPRVQITVTMLPLSHISCDSCIKDGISVNGDGENDDFDLCGLPITFPNFELNIYNRYGTVVYKGNKNTPLFEGTSNVSLTIGNKLPSGVYFYVFDPKDGVTASFQGNFYLSR